ncbi:MAG TPA: TIGR03435 family protein [Terriglobia bacterium]|nr:TIGR03435 family protein [Terriglobia bacterium]
MVDRTGISGSFPIFVYYSMSGDVSIDPSPYPDLVTAVEEQLGLKLEPAKTMVDTIVIDHAEKPTEN